jgi:hypothetical protein
VSGDGKVVLFKNVTNLRDPSKNGGRRWFKVGLRDNRAVACDRIGV